MSCDLNYRKKLWPLDKAQRVMTELMGCVDVLFTNEEEAEMMFGIRAGHRHPCRGVERRRL